MKKILQKTKEITNTVLSKLIACIAPTLPIMIGVGMLKALLILLGPLALNILSESSDTYVVLSFVADAGYYFMPIYTAAAAADVFGTDRFLAALTGAMLVSPKFVELTKQGLFLSVFSIPVAPNDYGNQVIVSILSVFILSKVRRVLEKILPNTIQQILLPMLLILIMVPISFSLIGPLGLMLSDLLVKVILFLKDLGPIGNGIMCAIIPFITIAGLGGANLSAMLLLASSGVDPILFFANVLYNNILGAVTLALYLKDRDPRTLAYAFTSAFAGSSEPALFGVVIKDSKALLSLSLSGLIAGIYAGLMGIKSFAMASFGIFGIISTIGEGSSILHAAIALILGCLIGFVSTFLTHYEQRR
ncbi:MAG: PTS transporter subunit EIIC [Erysipelotrichaceae bacterium]|nr:PTS transporter subunit EIIC [Erysipelotrichaceae bacterium]